MYFIRSGSLLIVISILLLLKNVCCEIPDICLGSPITAIEKVIFLDGIERYFVSSGQYYWFVNETSDLPASDSAQVLPFGFTPDAALIKDTRPCRNGQYVLLLIQKKLIIGSNEEEWLTMDYTIQEWGENGTDSGSWNQPSRIAHCRIDSKVCTTSDSYFATMSFDFKKGLDAAFGVIGANACFIQGSFIYNVTYANPCVRNPYTEVIAQQPQPLPTTVTAAFISDNNITLFDREFYVQLTDDIKSVELSDWAQAPNNFFEECQPLVTTLRTIINDLFTDSKSRAISTALVTIIAIICVLVLLAVCGIFVWFRLKRKDKRIITNVENVDEVSDSPLHEEHLLKNNSPKDVNNDTNQVRIPLQTSC